MLFLFYKYEKLVNLDISFIRILNCIYLFSGALYRLELELCKACRGCIFSCVRPFYERAVSDLGPSRSMVAHSSFIEGLHTKKYSLCSIAKLLNVQTNLKRRCISKSAFFSCEKCVFAICVF
jgi:hypothetical protein